MNTSSRRLEDFLIQYCSPFDSNVVSEMILNNFTTSGVTLNHIAKDGDMFGGVQLDFIKTLAICNSNLPSKLLLPSRVESLQLNNCAYDGILDLKDTLIGHKNNTQHYPCYKTLKNIAGLTKLTNINVGDNCLGIESTLILVPNVSKTFLCLAKSGIRFSIWKLVIGVGEIQFSNIKK